MAAKQAGVNSSGQRNSPSASSSGGGGGKSSGSGGGYNGEGRPDPAKTTSYGAPIHTDPYTGDQIAEGPAKWAGTEKRVADVNAANKDYADRGFLERLADVFGGPAFNENPPDINDPNTFWGGTYHTSTDVPGTVGMVAGMAGMVPGLGMATGMVASQAGKMAGIPEVYHNPAPAGTRESYGMEPEGGWSPAAGGTNTGTKGLVRDVTGGKQNGVGTQQTTGLVRQAPSQPVSPAPSPAPGDPTVTPPPSHTNYGFPTPSEKFGQSPLTYYYDPSTGQLHPRSAA